MKRFLVLFLLIFVVGAAAYSEDRSEQTDQPKNSGPREKSSSFSVALGMDFFNYEEIFLTTGVLFNFPLAVAMEGCIGADFSIWPHKDNVSGEITPRFFIPINAGINFLFQKQEPIFLLGVGLTPVFLIAPQTDGTVDPLRFYMGPYVKGGLRVRVHEMMNWYFEIQQDLLIGAPYWVNTTTRVYTGINFRLAPAASPK